MPNEGQWTEAEEPKGAEEQEPGYKALYEQEKAHSRSWGKKAKAFWSSVELTGNQTVNCSKLSKTMFWSSVELTGNQTGDVAS